MHPHLLVHYGIVLFGGLLTVLPPLTAAEAEDIKIQLPASDLTTSRKAFVVTVTIPEALGGEATATMELRRAEPGLATASVLRFTEPLPPVAGPGARTYQVNLSAAPLAEGEYSGTLTVAVGEVKQATDFTMFRMPEGRPRDFPIGIYAVPFAFNRDPETKLRVPDKEQQLRLIREMRAAGLNTIQQHMQGIGEYSWTMDQAARAGMRFMPSTNTSAAAPLDADTNAVWANGELVALPEWKRHCFFTPKVREAAAADFIRCVREYVDHPAFSGMIYYGDDMVMPTKQAEGPTLLTCYCPRCREAFKALTGQEPPVTYEPKSGVVPADDLLLQWMRFRCGEVYGGFHREMEKAKNTVDPSVAIGPIHGWSEQPFVRLEVGTYPPLSQTTTAVSSYTYPDLRSPRMDFISQYEIARMGNRAKDVWMLGQLTFDGVSPAWHIYQNYWNMIAAGYKMIGYFAWIGLDMEGMRAHGGYQNPPLTEEQLDELERHVKEGINALTRCNRHAQWILPTAGLWSPADSRNAVLYSFTTEAFDILPENRGKQHQEAITLFLREALRQHVPMKAICEEEIRAGMLQNLDALCLYDARALPDDVVKIVEDWAAQGGKLYVHDEARLKPKGAQPASVETMVRLIGDRTRCPARFDNRDIVLRELQAGDARYYLFVNNYADRYWGLPHYYGTPERNYQNYALVANEPARATVNFAEPGRYLFDMVTGEAAGNTGSPLNLELEPSWGKALVALPVPHATLRVTGVGTMRQGGEARYRLEIVGPDNQPVRGAFTVRVEVRTPSGRESRYSCYFGLKDGAGEFRLPLGINDETGTWTLTFEGGFPRARATQRLAVTAGRPLPVLLTAEALPTA